MRATESKRPNPQQPPTREYRGTARDRYIVCDCMTRWGGNEIYQSRARNVGPEATE
jgi:hypothetical protein